MPYLEVEPGRSLFYTDEGAGRPVLYLHGMTCDGSDWAWLATDLADGRRGIVMDHRGHGRSSPAARYSTRLFADDAAALLDFLDAGPAIVVGHSMGGGVASALAVQRPDLVAALMLVDPVYGMEDDELEAYVAAVRADPHGQTLAAFREFYGDRTPAWLPHWHRRRVLGTDPAVIVGAVEGTALGEDGYARRIVAERHLPLRRAPTIVLYAGSAAHRARWERGLPHRPEDVVEVWPEHGHFLHQEDPARVAARFRSWWDGVGLV
jgi:pimeloyl-ACP methyl ester carboxylesterase